MGRLLESDAGGVTQQTPHDHMHDLNDCLTLDLFPEDTPPKRPKTRQVLTGAQRQARYRQRSKERIDALSVRFSKLSDIAIARYMSDPLQDIEERKALWLEFGRRYGFK